MFYAHRLATISFSLLFIAAETKINSTTFCHGTCSYDICTYVTVTALLEYGDLSYM